MMKHKKLGQYDFFFHIDKWALLPKKNHYFRIENRIYEPIKIIGTMIIAKEVSNDK